MTATAKTSTTTKKHLFNHLEPVKVSPIIRGIRWILLCAGIFYGASKQKFLAVREVGIREEEEKLKKARDAAIKEERDRQSERDIQMLSDIFLGPQNTSEGSED